ncbi:hypothetical protein [Dactylosporangium sp. NPDC000521]|uniref:hypothetical protein n=1 Tax=Dactylosporangium sp. NPDC000521 TaxID=3363975 RepID=UPI0036760FA3
MEHIPQSRGDADEIISQQPIPTEQHASQVAVPQPRAEAPAQHLPVTFEEAEAHNPFALLGELRDHAMALRLDEKPAGFHLTELALSAAVVAWWSRWQPIAMHRAFRAGASLAEVAAAAGTTEAEAYDRWSRWAARQTQLTIAGRPSVEPDEVTSIRVRLDIPEPNRSKP